MSGSRSFMNPCLLGNIFTFFFFFRLTYLFANLFDSFFYSIIHVMTYFFHNPFDYFCALSLCFACKDQFAVIRR